MCIDDGGVLVRECDGNFTDDGAASLAADWAGAAAWAATVWISIAAAFAAVARFTAAS